MGLFGSISRTLFGGSKNKSSSTSESGNKAFDLISNTLSPALGAGANAFNQLGDVIGRGFEDYKKNAGFDFAYNQGTRDRVGAAAAKGLLNSGTLAKRLAQFEGDLGSTYYNNWLDRLGGFAQAGMGAASPIIAAGQYSKGQSTGKSTSGNGILSSLFG